MQERFKNFLIFNGTVIAVWIFLTVMELIKNDASCTFLCKQLEECSFTTMNCLWKTLIPALYLFVVVNLSWLVAMLVQRMRMKARK